MCVEACGAPGGMQLALAMTRPMGTVVLKSTCSVAGAGHAQAPRWSEIANDVVVQEKTIVGSRYANTRPGVGPFPPALPPLPSPLNLQILNVPVCRCGPFQPALDALQQPAMQALLAAMVDAEFPLEVGAHQGLGLTS